MKGFFLNDMITGTSFHLHRLSFALPKKANGTSCGTESEFKGDFRQGERWAAPVPSGYGNPSPLEQIKKENKAAQRGPHLRRCPFDATLASRNLKACLDEEEVGAMETRSLRDTTTTGRLNDWI
ncbi:hypothetical protein PG997_008779 [Apiospora hydei]|uniref:Uncharacterized protein n=1 Tax=Apiospora hydei TaxID=1337664 RepID=A0ABR1WEN0_9PEZI